MMKSTCRWLLFLVGLILPSSVWAQDPIPLASSGGVSLFSIPQPLPHSDQIAANPKSAKIIVRTDDPLAKLGNFKGIKIDGDVVQVSSFFLSNGSPFPIATGPLWAPIFTSLDTHLLVTEDMIGGGVYELSETNDGSLGSIDPDFSTLRGYVGIGATQMGPTDAFYLKEEFQSHEIELAQVVSNGSATITVTIQGTEDFGPHAFAGAAFDSVPIVFEVPEPNSGYLAMLAILGAWCRRKPTSDSKNPSAILATK